MSKADDLISTALLSKLRQAQTSYACASRNLKALSDTVKASKKRLRLAEEQVLAELARKSSSSSDPPGVVKNGAGAETLTFRSQYPSGKK